MKKRKPSLLDQVAAEQAAAPSLFLDEVSKGVDKMEKAGEFTAERLMESRPAIYRAIVEGHAQGLGIRQLCRAYSVSHHTVAVVLAREPKAIATLKEGTISTLRTFAKLAADRLLDEVNDIPIQQLAVPLGISIDKAQLLDGGATSRIEHTETGPTHDDYLKLISGEVIEAEIIPATGLRGETDSLKGAAEPFEVAAAVQAGGVLVDAEPVPAAGPALLPGQVSLGTIPTGNDENDASPDEQSGISEASYSVGVEDATPSATLPAGLEPHIEGSKSILGHPGASDETTSAVPAGKIKTGRAAGSTGSRASKSKRTEGGRGSQKSAAVSRGH
jgi:hypothetical protein